MRTMAVRRTVSAATAAPLMAIGAAVSITPAHADPEADQVSSTDSKKGVLGKNAKQAAPRTAPSFASD
jgi:hypothetical protein